MVAKVLQTIGYNSEYAICLTMKTNFGFLFLLSPIENYNEKLCLSLVHCCCCNLQTTGERTLYVEQ